MKVFNDNLPLNGKVRIPGSDEVHIYRGFEGDNTRRCALTLEGDTHIRWFDRAVIKVAA